MEGDNTSTNLQTSTTMQNPMSGLKTFGRPIPMEPTLRVSLGTTLGLADAGLKKSQLTNQIHLL